MATVTRGITYKRDQTTPATIIEEADDKSVQMYVDGRGVMTAGVDPLTGDIEISAGSIQFATGDDGSTINYAEV